MLPQISSGTEKASSRAEGTPFGEEKGD